MGIPAGSIDLEEKTVTTTSSAGHQLRQKLDALEHRLDVFGDRVKALERHTAELDQLRREIGNLKLEVEEFREAD